VRAFRIAYDGRDFHGFQRQPDVPTVSDAVLDAIGSLEVAADRVPPGYAAAGRTDAGVSGTAQTVAFVAPDWLDPAALNSGLPAAVRAWASADAPSDFHATHDATAREYTYYLHARAAHDEARARTALDRLAGEHDFHNLTPDESGTIRRLRTGIQRDGEFLVVTFRAGGFPRQLVRRLVTVVDEVARGDAGLERVEHVLGDESLVGPEGVAPAPAAPLVLTGVTYPALTFERDAKAAASAREVFLERRREALVRTRVAGRLADR
jgi:tRNA pseudouridine38-40 synthase